MAKEPEQIDRNTLYDRLSEILTKGTLYRPFLYTGEGLDISHTASPEGGGYTYGLLPKTIPHVL